MLKQGKKYQEVERRWQESSHDRHIPSSPFTFSRWMCHFPDLQGDLEGWLLYTIYMLDTDTDWLDPWRSKDR